MTNLGERIRALATGQAVFFRLKMQLTDNSVRVFPPEVRAPGAAGKFSALACSKVLQSVQ